MNEFKINQQSNETNSNTLPGVSENPTLSIVIPAYFEQGNIDYLYKEIVKALGELNIKWELIIVDDGSTDKTWLEISQLNKMDKRVKGLRFCRNFGHQYSLFAGLNFAAGKAVVTMDADMQHPPDVIPRLLEEWNKGFKIVNTIRIYHSDTKLSKRITSDWFYKIFSYLSGVDLKAGMADFRLLDRQVVKEFLKLKENGLFLRALVQWLGFPSSNIEFTSGERLYGKTKYNFRRMIKFAWTGIISFSLKPLRIGIIFGILTSVFAFIQLFLALYDYFVLRETVPGWTSLIVITTFLFGVLFVLLGIIGEYVGRILVETRNRPRFIISDFLGFSNEVIDSLD
jgi:polyisoprenyl-phosphate glycosyltransferase